MKIPQLIEQNKHIFGTYSAMALKNVQIVLDHIQKIVGIEREFPRTWIGDDGKKHSEGAEDFWKHDVIRYLWGEEASNVGLSEKSATIRDMLFRSFPFLKIMADNNREYENKKQRTSRLEIINKDITYALNNILRVLKKYRDYSVHSIFVDNGFDDESNFLAKNESPLSYTINDYYTVALRNVKERYNYSVEQLAFIQDYRYKRVKNSEGGRSKMVVDFDFFLSMQAINGDKMRKSHLSGVGVVQLICFFLEKKYVNIFLSKLPICDIYSKDSEESRIIRRSLSINSVRLPKERIQSKKKNFSIALDMLNELKRCPKELYDTLSFEDQDCFRIISSDYNEVLLSRSTDRFVQLSLQYIDYNKLFNSIRFHVNMGKMRTLFAPSKHCIDGQDRVRVIEKSLNGYGRIQEIEEHRKNNDGTFWKLGVKIRDFDEIQRDDSCADNYPYIVDTYSNYLIKNNKIDFCFSSKNIVPEFEKGEDGERDIFYNVAPDCRMSVFELPAMMFHLLLLGGKRTEERIKEVYNNYKRLFAALSTGALTKENVESFNIALRDMPQTLVDAINEVKSGKNVNNYIARVLNEEISDTTRRIERIKTDKKTIARSNNKMGTRNYHPISTGKLADFLAKDIVKYQPSLRGDGTDKITGLNYRVMQSSIALYNSNGNNDLINEFANIFKRARLIGGDKDRTHPFLYKALSRQPKNAIEFYEKYLQSKKRYLEDLRDRFNNKESVELPFINKTQNKWLKRNAEFYKIMGEIYNEDVAVELPRQMFDEEIKAKLKSMPEMQGVDFDNANITYLIGEYLRRVLDDDFQEFYSFERNYQYIDKLICKPTDKGSLSKQFTDTTTREEIWECRQERIESYIEWSLKNKNNNRQLQSLTREEYVELLNKSLNNSRNAYQKSEKHIRRYKVQDVLFFMMAKQTLSENIDFTAENFKLRDIMPNTDRGILSEIMPIDFVFEKGGKTYTIKSRGIKLKNYGDFFTLVHDKRLSSLLDILPEDTLDKDEITQEFDNYDNCRPEIVKLVLEFERYVYDKYPDIKSKAIHTQHFDFLAMLNKLLEKGDLRENEKEVLRLIRNAFNHNVYPERGIIMIRTLPEVAVHLKEMFGQYTQII